MSLLLALTTSLHYLAIIPIIAKYRNVPIPYFNRIYINIICVSTTVSIIWHYFDILMETNYILSGLWFCQDILWSLLLTQSHIIYLNLIIFALNIIISYMNNYVFYHSLWHMLSAIKCIYISYTIYKIDNQTS